MATFCKAIKAKENLHTCVVPEGFLDGDGVVPANLTLATSSGSSWSVAIREDSGDFLLDKGWRSFCLDNELSLDDVVVMKRIQPSNVLVTIYGGDGCERKKSQSCDIAKANNPFGSEVNSGNNCKQETRDRITADDYHEIIDNGNILKRSMDHPEVPLKKRAKTTVGSEKSTAKKLIKVTLSCSSRTVSSESAIAAASKFECSNPSVLLATTKSTLDPTYYLVSVVLPPRHLLLLRNFVVILQIVHKQFSEAFMPKVDTAVMLVNSRDERFPARWLAARHVVSGGWRGFARAEKIKVGDALVLEVVDESTFKIHVFE
ncbi:uncharacterized protein LOC112343215 [Selaginella moellendorffii]|uniref:uncharacterized protein LOC112343215 n=1 Tax=Selaginella moellendorffii TaxID=88036 RepID=UPI000D1C4D36|nr:uncharacterized protein LOC112343215 [Selaginella moellendorffii]|eukprot:XP_024522101.1 uncharacterized protein LOC112343215 [Selaginella moellendorffii]